MRGALPSLPSRLALWAIRLYQRHLSPIKGFSCAYRLATGGQNCSAYGYRVIGRHGLLAGLMLLDRRLQRCGAAHRGMSAPSVPDPKLRYQRGDCDCGGCDIGDLDGCCGSGGCDVPGDCGSKREHPGRRCEPFHRWREKRWMAKAERLRRERAERERRERFEKERREREQRP